MFSGAAGRRGGLVIDSTRGSAPRALASAVGGMALVAGLVTVPPQPPGVTATQIDVGAVALSALSSATSSSAPTPDQILEAVATVAIGAAAMPLWYLAFPVTLPASLAMGGLLIELVDIGGLNTPVAAIVGSAVLGLGIFAVGPLGFAIAETLPRFTPGNTRAAAAVEATPRSMPQLEATPPTKPESSRPEARDKSTTTRRAESGAPKKTATRAAAQRTTRSSATRASRAAVSAESRGRPAPTIGEP